MSASNFANASAALSLSLVPVVGASSWAATPDFNSAHTHTAVVLDLRENALLGYWKVENSDTDLWILTSHLEPMGHIGGMDREVSHFFVAIAGGSVVSFAVGVAAAAAAFIPTISSEASGVSLVAMLAATSLGALAAHIAQGRHQK